MTPFREVSGWPVATIQAGAGLFLAALAASIFLDPAIWVLHALQALIYVAIILLVRRNSSWGFGAGLAIALLWNSANLFVTGFILGGVSALGALLHTGHISRPALLLVLIGAGGHFLMIGGCLVGFVRLSPKTRKWAELVGGAVLVVAALVLISPLRTHALPLPLDVPPGRDIFR